MHSGALQDPQRLVLDLSDLFVRPGSRVYDLGASTGETTAALQRRHAALADVRYVALDSSAPMLAQAAEKCAPGNVEFVHQDVADMDAPTNADLVLALYTLQFLPVARRQAVLDRICTGLRPGGALILAEKVAGADADQQARWADLLARYKLAMGLTAEMIAAKERSLEGVLVPVTLEENRRLLARAGFTGAEILLRWCGFVTLLAVKP